MFVESFSLHRLARPQRVDITRALITSSSAKNDDTASESTDVDISNINEAQLLLACRSWLLRKHKLEWKGKKRRSEAAASPLNNEGYFWHDPNELHYLREDPDPYNLEYNQTYEEYWGYKRNGVRLDVISDDTTYSGQNYLVDELEDQVDADRASTSSNPFSTNPLYPDIEHVRRSEAKLKLWNNETWKEEWYNRRWKGKVATKTQKNREKQKKLVRNISNDVLESPSFDSMSEEEVMEAIITYLNANQRKSTSRKSNKYKRHAERESFREWRKQVKRDACETHTDGQKTTTVKDIVSKVGPPSSNNDVLSFSPSVETMKKLRAQRSEKAKKAFQTRLANSKAKDSSSPTKEITKLKHSYNQDNSNYENDEGKNDEPEGEISPMQALLNIDSALDQNKFPSPVDIEIILRPGRLGRRRATLLRILSECFDLRGKCVPSLSEDSDLFVTKCTIHELGAFVMAKLRQNVLIQK